MLNTIVGAGAALRYGSGSAQMMQLLSALAPALQHWLYNNYLALNSNYQCLHVFLQYVCIIEIYNEENSVYISCCSVFTHGPRLAPVI
jgi:hypothetical protein